MPILPPETERTLGPIHFCTVIGVGYSTLCVYPNNRNIGLCLVIKIYLKFYWFHNEDLLFLSPCDKLKPPNKNSAHLLERSFRTWYLKRKLLLLIVTCFFSISYIFLTIDCMEYSSPEGYQWRNFPASCYPKIQYCVQTAYHCSLCWATNSVLILRHLHVRFEIWKPVTIILGQTAQRHIQEYSNLHFLIIL